MFIFNILIVADGPVPHPYMNYRADPLAKYFSERGYDISVLCAKPFPTPYNQAEDFKNVNFFYIPQYRSVRRQTDLIRRSYQLFFLLKRLRHLLRERKFDVIRAISFSPAYSSIVANRGLNLPLVTNLSDFYSDLYKQFGLSLPFFATGLLRKMEETIVRESDVFIVDSSAQRKYWKSWGLNEKKCVVLPHGLPRSYGHLKLKAKNSLDVKMKYGIAKKTKVVFYIGDISQLDGLDILIAAAPSILRENRNTRFMIIGSGTRNYMQSLKKQIRTAKIEKYFIFINRIPNFQVPEYIAAADVCVAPFRITLTSNSSVPNKVLEYFSMRKPIVTTEGNGIKEMFGPLIKYVEPENPQKLANAILDVLIDNLFTSKIQDDLKKTIEKLNWKNIVQHEETIINAAIDRETEDLRVFDYRLN